MRMLLMSCICIHVMMLVTGVCISISCLWVDFTSAELDALPFTFTRGDLSHESHVQFSESHNGDLAPSDFVTSVGRRRRSLDPSHWRVKRSSVALAITANFGDIVNPAVGGVSGSPLELLVGGCMPCHAASVWLSIDMGMSYIVRCRTYMYSRSHRIYNGFI